MELTRRSALKAGAGAVAATGVAGCLASPFEGGDDDEGYAAFFALWDWAEQVGGEHFSFVNPVEAGEMGHGWSPDGDITRNIASSELFIYLDTPEFSWAQDIAAELERDYDDVAVVDLLEGLESELLRSDAEAHDTDDHDDHDHSEDDDHDDHDQFYDPHVWVDPVLATEMVDTIADSLAELDPEHAEEYRENAAAYGERIESVHHQFEELVENAERDVAVLAAHDSFGYLEHRYGFELRTPVGITPNAVESFEDVSGLVDVVESHDIDTVLYDPFEASDPDEDVPQMVEVLFEHTDVENAEPLSATEGTTAEWNDRGWGWIEQMEEMNLPSLRAALGASADGQNQIDRRR